MPGRPFSPHAAFLLHAPSGGGAQRRTVALAERLAGRGLATELLLVSKDGPQPLPDGVPVSVLRSALPWPGRRLQVSAAIPALAERLRRAPPDVLVAGANHVHMLALAAHAMAQNPCALVLRASNSLIGGGRGTPVWDWMKRRSALFYRRADVVVAVSGAIADQVARLAPGLRVAVLPNPVIDETFPDRMRAPVQHPWFRTRAAPVVLGVGRLEKQKGFPTLLRAAARAKARVILLGEGSQRRYLAELARALDVWLDMPGFVADPLPWMAQSSVFCLSSAWEGMPGALIEAMACGCPVIATDVPGASEILEHGRLGPLVPAGDDAALGDALAWAIAMPPDRLALQRKAAEYSVEAGAAAYQALLTEIAEQRRSRSTAA